MKDDVVDGDGGGGDEHAGLSTEQDERCAAAAANPLYGKHPKYTRGNRPNCMNCGRRLERKNRRQRNRPHPLCRPCVPAVRIARQLAHRTFDAIWRSGVMSRHAAIRWLSVVIGVPLAGAHISMLTADQCSRLRAAVHAEFDLSTGAPR